jgi:type VI secretion system secreted protein Hcp
MAVDMFIKIDGIDGGSVSHKHKGEIELLSFSWGLTNSTTSTGGGGGAGKPTVSDFSIIKQMDQTSPHLFEKCCQGERISDVLVTLVNKEKGQEFYKIKLTDCIISSYQTSGGSSGGIVPMESVSFNFSNVDLSAADKNGQFVSQVACNFNKGGSNVIGHDHD